MFFLPCCSVSTHCAAQPFFFVFLKANNCNSYKQKNDLWSFKMFFIKHFAFFIKLKSCLLGEVWSSVRGQWEDRVRQEGVKVIAWSARAKSLLIFKARYNSGFFFCFSPNEGHCVSILGCVSSDSPFFQHWLLTSPDTISQPISAENWQAQLQQQNGKFKRKYTRDRHRMLLV